MLNPKWVRFRWDLNKLPETPPVIDVKLRSEKAKKTDEDQVRLAVESSYSLDPGWSVGLDELLADMRHLVDASFDEKAMRVQFLTMMAGKRIVGVSGVSADGMFSRQLLTGVCVIDEYRCRGVGSVLLYESLSLLREGGLSEAIAYTRKGVVADKYLYPKFGGEREEVEGEIDPLVLQKS